MAQTERLLTTPQVAELLGLHIRKVQRLAESGDLPVRHKLPGPYGRYVFDATEVELWRYRQAEGREDSRLYRERHAEEATA